MGRQVSIGPKATGVICDRHRDIRPEERTDDSSLPPAIRTHALRKSRLVMTAKIREIFALKPEEFDPRKYLGPAREALRCMHAVKNKNVLGSTGRASEIK